MARHVDTPSGRAVLTATEARAAQRGGLLRVLAVSLVLAVAAMLAIYLFLFS